MRTWGLIKISNFDYRKFQTYFELCYQSVSQPGSARVSRATVDSSVEESENENSSVRIVPIKRGTESKANSTVRRLTGAPAKGLVSAGKVFGIKIFDFWPNFRFLDNFFYFWPNFLFLDKFSILGQIFDFCPNFRFLVEFSIFDQIEMLIKIVIVFDQKFLSNWNVNQNCNRFRWQFLIIFYIFWWTFRFLTKIRFLQNFHFVENYRFCRNVSTIFTNKNSKISLRFLI